MKPSLLKPFFTFEKREVTLEDGIWCVPNYFDRYEDYPFEGFDSPSYFSKNQPVVVEFCSGNGDWIIQKAKNNPHLNFVAIEIQFKRVKKIWSKRHNEGINNLLIICGDGRVVLKEYLKSNSLEGVFINFPDPWPKKKHIKHRIIQTSFVEQLCRCLMPQRQATFVSDDKNYLEQSLQLFLNHPDFISCYPAPHYLKNPHDHGFSYFEDLWKSMGRDIYMLKVEKKSSPNGSKDGA